MASAKVTAVEGRTEGGDNIQPKSGLGATLASVGDTISSYVGGGNDENKDEGYIDKGIDAVQQNIVGQSNQDQGSAAEEVKDHHVAEMLRNQYKSNSEKDGVE